MKQLTINKKTYTECPEAKTIATEILTTEDMIKSLDIDIPRVEFIAVYPNISKSIAGKCIKSGRELKYFSDCDYIIEVSGEIWDTLNVETKRILILHELLHIKITYNKKNETVYGIRDHDIKDFSQIISKYGIDWFNTLKLSISSLYDFDPSKENSIKI